MAATDQVYGRFQCGTSEVPVKNTSGSAMTTGQSVKLDTANPLSVTQPAIGVVLTSAVSDITFGFLIENIPAGGYGRCATIDGTVVQAIAAGAISAGATVGPSAATAGDVTTYTAANPSSGIAITAAANAADPILVQIRASKNA